MLIGDIFLYKGGMQFITENPTIIILQAAALIPIVAVAYIISLQYHFKTMLSTLLGTKVKTDEAILERLNELIIVTDRELNILSVNDAVERTLQKSRSELLNAPLLSMVILKNKDGIVVDNKYFFPDGKNFQVLNTFLDDCTIVNSASNDKKVTVQVQPIEGLDGSISQITFILSYSNKPVSDEDILKISLGRARTKYEAMSENLKNKFAREKNTDSLEQIVLMDTLENDIFAVESLKNRDNKSEQSNIDIAQLCKQAVQLEQDFAKIFAIPIGFEIRHFDWKAIAPQSVNEYEVKPEQLTGPFFTVSCDVQQIGLLIKKILDLDVLLASSEAGGEVHLSVEQNEETVTVQIKSSCPKTIEKEQESLFTPYYNTLSTKTNLQAGSGLEGYLVKTISTKLGLDMDITFDQTPSPSIIFTIKLPKDTVNKPAAGESVPASKAV